MAARDTALGDDVPSDDSVIGFFDRIHRGVLAGWAINRSVPDTPLKLGLWFKGVCIHVASADTFRPDLAQAFGTRGFHGFEFECPTDLRAVDVLDIEVIPVGACSPLQKVEDVILRHGTRLVQTGAPHPDQPNNSGALWKRYRSVPRDFSLAQREPKIGIVIVNRNGSERLERLFASVKQHNSYQSMTFFIIDQGSTDDSRLVCARWAMRLPITFIERRINFSIAASRNYGARLASDCGLLMFLKSDIELCADALPSMAAFMSHDDCCLLGVRLRTGADGPGVSNAHSDHLGIALDDCAPGVVFNPYEILAAGADDEISADAWEVPVVSGDFMMIRRTHFESIGGFDEGYRDGFEDVDLCLMARQRLGKRNFCMTEFAARRQTDPLRPASHDENFRLTRRNLRRLENRAGALVRSEMIADMFRQPPLLRPRPTRIAFAVTAVDMSGEAGDYLTACELGAELSRLYGWHVSYLEHAFWYDLDYFDIVVAMRHDFDPALIQSANPHLVLVGWARNWCDLWLSNRQTRQFDQIWASSSKFAQALRVRLGQRTPVIRIASNTTRFSCGKFCSSLQSDYCFTGSYFQSPRDIISAVNPESVPFSFAIYGHNWEKVPALASFSRGPLSYGRMPDVYASTKIVIDDSNFTTLQWGTLNSRVFDALASGALVLTNNSVGSDETFDGLLPHWSSRAELTDLLNHYLRNDTARQIVADKLKSIVFHRHSYTRRAQEVYQALSELVQARHRVGIVIASTFPSSEREALIDAIRSAVDCQSFIRARREIGGRSADESSAGDDVRIVIAAPGLEAKLATLRDDQVNILIALGSPADVAPGEIDRFDIAFVGDDEMARAFTSRTRVPVRALFDQPGSMARNVIRFDENGAAISLIDSYCLQIAVKKAIERHADICSSLTSAKREMRVPFRLARKSSAGSDAVPFQSARLLFYPDYRRTNPYQTLLYNNVGPDLSVGPGTIEEAIRLVEESGPVVVFHLHWTAPILGVEGGEAEVKGRRDAFLLAVDRFLALGGRMFWTVHNRVSHEAPFPDIEAEFYSELARRAATVHVHSQLVPDMLADIVRLSPAQLLVGAHGNYVGCVPDQISREQASARLRIETAATTFLFFGQIRAYKGVEALLDAFELLTDESPVQLIVAGMPSGGATHRDTNAVSSRFARCPGVVYCLDFIPDEEVQIYFRAADAVILPYRAVLTSGSAILALSFGKPVIAPSLGLITDLVRDGVEGLLYDPDEADGLLRAMRRFLKLDANARTSMEAAARARAGELSWEQTGKALYMEAMAGAVGRAEIQGPAGLRCFVRRGAAPRNRAVVAILHQGDVAETLQCVETITTQREVPVDVVVVSSCENATDYILLCEYAPSATVVQAPPGTTREESYKLASALAEQGGCQFAGLVTSDFAFRPAVLAALMDSASRHPTSTASSAIRK